MSLFKNIWSDIEGFFSDAEKDTVTFIESLVDSIAANGGAVLISAATGAVAAAEATGGTAATKLAAAVASVTSTLTTQGIPVVQNAINGAIEAAVAQMKTQAPNATASASA